MTIYAVVQTKGGVGKTTTAAHLANHLATQGPSLFIDGDPQESAATWAAWRRQNASLEGRSSPTTVRLTGKAILDEGRQLARNYHNTVIDAGGRDAPGLRNALLLAEIAIVPVGASSFDTAAMDDLLEVIEMAKTYNPALLVKVLLTRIDLRTKDTKELEAYLKETQLDVLNARVCERVAFRRVVGHGGTVEELGRDQQAVAEMMAFYSEVTQ